MLHQWLDTQSQKSENENVAVWAKEPIRKAESKILHCKAAVPFVALDVRQYSL